MVTNDTPRGGTGQEQVPAKVDDKSGADRPVHSSPIEDLSGKLREDFRSLIGKDDEPEEKKPRAARKPRPKKVIAEPQPVVAEAPSVAEADTQSVEPASPEPRPVEQVLQKCREIETIFERALGVPPKVDLRGIIDSLETRARIDLTDV